MNVSHPEVFQWTKEVSSYVSQIGYSSSSTSTIDYSITIFDLKTKINDLESRIAALEGTG